MATDFLAETQRIKRKMEQRTGSGWTEEAYAREYVYWDWESNAQMRGASAARTCNAKPEDLTMMRCVSDSSNKLW